MQKKAEGSSGLLMELRTRGHQNKHEVNLRKYQRLGGVWPNSLVGEYKQPGTRTEIIGAL